MSAFWKSISTKCHCRVALRASGLLSRKASAQVARLAMSRSVRSSLSFLSSARTCASASGLSFLRIDSATSATISWPSLPQPKLGVQPSVSKAAATTTLKTLCCRISVMANPSRLLAPYSTARLGRLLTLRCELPHVVLCLGFICGWALVRLAKIIRREFLGVGGVTGRPSDPAVGSAFGTRRKWVGRKDRLIRINNRKIQDASEHNPALTTSARCGLPHEMTQLTLKTGLSEWAVWRVLILRCQ